jgi:tripartite ATP-independent transporter DctM subunit
MSPFAWLCVSFVCLLALRVPVAFAIAIASFVGFAFIPDPFDTLAPYALFTDITGGVKQLSLIAIPFFILAGSVMGQGGMGARLIGFSQSLIGWVRGGTAYVNVMTSMFFGGVSGSAVADTSSIGSILIPMMRREGYDARFATAVTVCSSTIGLIIPPSNTMILYAVIAGGAVAATGAYAHVMLEVRTMFLAGLVPGILIGLGLMATCGVLSRRRGYPKGAWLGAREVARRFARASLALVVVAIILGGILSGFVTADESAAVAVALAFIVALFIYRELTWRQAPGIVGDAVVTTGVVFFLIGASNAMKFIFIHEGIDRALLEFCQALTANRYMFLLILNVVLLVCGTFLDMTPAILIFTPLFLPVALHYGVHPIHFGLILTVNLCIGLCTPPVGNCLFVGCGISGVPLTKMIRPMLPFYAAMVAVLLVVTYYEPFTMWLPARWMEWFPPLRPAAAMP